MANRSDILTRAETIVNGNREQDYGKPEDNFKLIADIWSSYLGVKLNSMDVANMMIGLKIARIKTGHGSIDCFIDIAGYAACAGEIFSKELEEQGVR